MIPTRPRALRRIAESEVARLFGDLGDAARNELATSLVRQWITLDGYAAILTATRPFWFRLLTPGNGILEVELFEPEWTFGRFLVRECRFAEGEVSELLHRLNVGQTAVGRDPYGRVLRLRIDPKERCIRFEEASDEELEL